MSANCKGYGKSTLFQTYPILDVDNLGYESDFMSRVHLEYDCCEELNVKFSAWYQYYQFEYQLQAYCVSFG